MSKKIGRNDPCWCGSNQKYKKCHMIRSNKPTLPFKAIVSKMRKKGAISTCLHPNASNDNCEKVIAAHTLQRSRVLRAITDSSKKVRTFYPPEYDDNGRYKLHKKGWFEASTFSAFCKKHDDITFSELEKTDYTGSKKEIFLIAYRAICWEVYQKMKALNNYSTVRDLIDRGSNEHLQTEAQKRIALQNNGFKKGLKDLEIVKKGMDRALVTGNLKEYSTYEIVINGSVSVVATGAITPNRLLDGTPIQILHDIKATIQSVAYGVDVRPDGASIVFLWSSKDEASNAFVNDIDKLSDKELSEYLVQFFFAYCENTYFADSWWKTMNARQRDYLQLLSENSNPYYYPPDFDYGMMVSPWVIGSRNWN